MARTKVVFVVFGSWIVLSVYFLKMYTDLYETLEETRRRKAEEWLSSDPANSIAGAAFMRDFYLPRITVLDYGNSDFYNDGSTVEKLSVAIDINPNFDELFTADSNVTRVDVCILSSDRHRLIQPHAGRCGDGWVVLDSGNYRLDEIEEYDVIVFEGEITNDRVWDYLVENRDPKQLWLLHMDDNPFASMYFLPPEGMTGATFNLSYTYHSASEIRTPHGYFIPQRSGDPPRRSNSLRQPKKLASWYSGQGSMASWDRYKFVESLSEFMSIDVWSDLGNRGNMSCGTSERGTQSGRGIPRACRQVLGEYKFVLALEESCCSEYMTDVLWNAFYFYHNVPVVVGASKEDYQKLAPPNSFIFAGDFNTTRELALYLLEVASDPDLYNSFFDWWEHGTVRVTSEKDRSIRDEHTLCGIYNRTLATRSDEVLGVKTKLDPYGSHWLGGCTRCQEYHIIHAL